MKLSKSESKFFLKVIEEISELSLELIHAVNKPNKENLKNIKEEMLDVEIAFKPLKDIIKNKK